MPYFDWIVSISTKPFNVTFVTIFITTSLTLSVFVHFWSSFQMVFLNDEIIVNVNFNVNISMHEPEYGVFIRHNRRNDEQSYPLHFCNCKWIEGKFWLKRENAMEYNRFLSCKWGQTVRKFLLTFKNYTIRLSLSFCFIQTSSLLLLFLVVFFSLLQFSRLGVLRITKE